MHKQEVMRGGLDSLYSSIRGEGHEDISLALLYNILKLG